MKNVMTQNRSAMVYMPFRWFTVFISFILLSCLFAFSSSASAKNNLTASQQAFLDAYDAIRANDRRAIAKYKKQLKDYALYPYLLFHDYRLHISNTPNHLIESFVNEHQNSYIGDALYNKWLAHLAKTKQWKKLSSVYTPQKKQDLQCYHIQALAHTNQLELAIEQSKPIWVRSTKLSRACRPIDTLLRKHKSLTGPMVWERIELALEKRHYKTATHLARDLSKTDKQMVSYWQKVLKEPSLVNQRMPSYVSTTVRKKAFTQGVKYLAKKDPKEARLALIRYSQQYGLDRSQFNMLEQYIALRTAYQYAPEAKDYLKNVNLNGQRNDETLRWQAQVALKNSDWPELLDTLDLMEPEAQDEKQWMYWRARALEATNRPQAAHILYNKLAKDRHYYAFLAADRLNLPYQFNPKPVEQIDTKQLIAKYPELTRIKELLAVNWELSSKREWYQLLNKADADELHAVAVLADQWEQHAQAIRSLAKAEEWNVLQLRFPTPYKEPIMQNAKKNDIDPAWIYGIIRRESAFSEDIRSPVGATGLMQLMPQTAKYINNKIGGKRNSYKRLTEAQNNIELGSAYLSYLNKKFDGNKVLATASYNAGPRRVESWIPEHRSLPADQWVDSIPYSETRAYVKAVLEYTTIFKSLLNQKHDRLQDVMPEIGIVNTADKDKSKIKTHTLTNS